jgi:hypothetical protein
MRCHSSLASVFVLAWFTAAQCQVQSARAETRGPLRVGLVGLVHGHVQGFPNSPSIARRLRSWGSLNLTGNLLPSTRSSMASTGACSLQI